MRVILCAGILLQLSIISVAQPHPYKPGKVIYKDGFQKDLKNWVIESPASLQPKIEVVNGKLSIEVTGGATAWFKKKLSGNYMVQFKRKVIVADSPRDRLSDFNMFWAASDPKNVNLFTRTGVLEEYDSLRLYYVGIGGNSNTTTRFRKYPGNGERTLIKEYLDKQHLLVANKEYLVQILVFNGTTELIVDGEEFFSYKDKEPLTAGYFGIRTTKSHHEIDDFKVLLLR